MLEIARMTSEADNLIRLKDRAKLHSTSERSRDVEDVMATVTSPDELTWSHTLCWAVNETEPDGSTSLEVYTSLADVRRFYENWRLTELTVGTGPLLSDIRSGWYTFSDSVTTPLQNITTQAIRRIDSVVLFLMDGTKGISAEICWRRCADVTLTAGERAGLWISFLTALRQQNVDDLMALMSPSVQGAVRDYTGAEPPFVGIKNADAMRAHYEEFFERFEVLDIATCMCIVRDWFVFSELRWKVRLRSGPDRGREMRFLTAEHMPFGSDGLFQARCGFGTELE